VQFDRAHRVDDALEFDEHPLAGGLGDATAMLGDFGVAEDRRIAFSRASAPSSSAPMSRE
jgi:hypothetical protein